MLNDTATQVAKKIAGRSTLKRSKLTALFAGDVVTYREYAGFDKEQVTELVMDLARAGFVFDASGALVDYAPQAVELARVAFETTTALSSEETLGWTRLATVNTWALQTDAEAREIAMTLIADRECPISECLDLAAVLAG